MLILLHVYQLVCRIFNRYFRDAHQQELLLSGCVLVQQLLLGTTLMTFPFNCESSRNLPVLMSSLCRYPISLELQCEFSIFINGIGIKCKHTIMKFVQLIEDLKRFSTSTYHPLKARWWLYIFIWTSYGANSFTF